MRNNLQPAVIYSAGVRVALYKRCLLESDELSLILDLDSKRCALYINQQQVYVFEGITMDSPYVMGCTLCDDHKVTIIERKFSLKRCDLSCAENYGYDDDEDECNEAAVENINDNHRDEGFISNSTAAHIATLGSVITDTSATRNQLHAGRAVC